MELEQQKIEEIKKERLINNLLNDDMKVLIPYLDDDNVTDIAIPISGQLIVTRFAQGTEFTGINVPPYISERIIKATSYIVGKSIDSNTGFPILEGVIPKYNARITGILPPVTMQPIISIRKPPKKIFTLEEYVEKKQMSKKQYNELIKFIKERKNIVVSGSTGAGKTTFTNALLNKMKEFTPEDNFYVVEDTPELQCNAPWMEPLWIKTEDAEKAVKAALRFFPDRIIFGEVRDGGLLEELLKSWLTHTGNVTTIHATSGQNTLLRIRSMLGDRARDISEHLSEVIHLVVHLSRTDKGIKVDEIYPVTEETDSFLAGLIDNNLG